MNAWGERAEGDAIDSDVWLTLTLIDTFIHFTQTAPKPQPQEAASAESEEEAEEGQEGGSKETGTGAAAVAQWHHRRVR